ncbi:MAG: M81 family metallopeptidase, partial [Chloroflexota bacterium]|nr:M81 family metallopeptidase [Chloroflexota bacterium]
MSITIAIGGISHETNTFALTPTTLADFEAAGLYRGDEMDILAGTNSVIGGAMAAAQANGVRLARSISGHAIPGGTVSSEAFETIVGEIEAGVRAQPVDAVILDLHGAMVTEGFPGGDGEVARRIRSAVGPDVPVLATFDLHGNIDQTLIDSLDVPLPYNTYPHIDNAERGAEAVDIAVRMIRGEIRPVTRAVKIAISPPSPKGFSG